MGTVVEEIFRLFRHSASREKTIEKLALMR
jgi:hypothetical protein